LAASISRAWLSRNGAVSNVPFFDGVVDLLKRHSGIVWGPGQFAGWLRGRIAGGLYSGKSRCENEEQGAAYASSKSKRNERDGERDVYYLRGR